MKVLVTGGSGQVGQALRITAPPKAEIIAPSREEFDLAKPDQLATKIEELAPDVLINSAAYTAVDAAEHEPELAMLINADAVLAMAKAAKHVGTRFVQISTDFVFDGAATEPYPTDTTRNPLSVYGRTKAAGEDAAGSDSLIVRTSWVYAASHKNFVTTMLNLMTRRDSLSVVSDQIGSPTSATGLANAIWQLVEQEARGVYHHCDAGMTSWHEFAAEIKKQALRLGLLEEDIPITAIKTQDFPVAAKRPSFSVLDCSKTVRLLGDYQADWRKNLQAMLIQERARG